LVQGFLIGPWLDSGWLRLPPKAEHEKVQDHLLSCNLEPT